jgi:hypothetical protein
VHATPSLWAAPWLAHQRRAPRSVILYSTVLAL